MNKYTFAILFLFNSIVNAGEFSKIDEAVREIIVENYSRGIDDQKFNMSYDDIWALELTSEPSTECQFIVKGLALKPNFKKKSTYQFWVCLNKTESGAYEGELIEDVQVAD